MSTNICHKSPNNINASVALFDQKPPKRSCCPLSKVKLQSHAMTCAIIYFFSVYTCHNCICFLLVFLMLMMMCFILFLVLGVVVSNYGVSATGGVFHVKHKFAGQPRSLSAMKEHDLNRHGRSLFSVDVPLGGDGKLPGTGLYYTKLKIGSPPNDYFVLVDTGSDLLWVNCIHCSGCPKKSDLGVDLTLYDPSSSVASKMINCDNDFCTLSSDGPIPDCAPGLRCPYRLSYEDGSTSSGYFVKDVIQYDRVSANLQTTPATSSVIFGCGNKQSGNLQDSASALDGIIGFGQSEISMISQIAATGSMKKMFAHCLDSKNGGGIFAMGNVVQPKVKTTPLLPNQTDYNVNLESILIGKDPLQLPKGVLGAGTERETIIDSGTTLAYLPEDIYTPLIKKIMANQGDLDVHTVEDTFSCFEYNPSLDADLPTVTLNFEGSLQLVVYPHDYLFEYEAGAYCFGWQSSETPSSDMKDMIVLGGSTSIKVQDEQSKEIFDVEAHRLSSGRSQDMGILTIVLLLCAVLHTYAA